MPAVSEIINRAYDIMLTPLMTFPGLVGIIFLSVLSAVMVLTIFKYTSNQEKIRYHKKKISGNLIQIALYSHQIRVIAGSIISIAKHNLAYLGWTVPSLAALAIPLFIFTTQVHQRFGYAPIRQGQSFIVQVELDKTHPRYSSQELEAIELKTSPGIVIETRRLRIPPRGEIFWRARLQQESKGQFIRLFSSGRDKAITRKVVNGRPELRFAPRQMKPTGWASLVNYAEDYLDAGSMIKSIRVSYYSKTYPLLWWQVDVIILYFLLTLVSALLLKPFFNVSL